MLEKAKEFIRKNLPLHHPETAVILGTGLGDFVGGISRLSSLEYKNIPGFPESTVQGHKGELLHGYLGDKELLCLNGRFHLYEGHDPAVIADVIHLLKDLGISRLIVTNAAGSLRQDMPPGTLMLINDHINFSGKNPLVGSNNEKYGPRFPAMNGAYTESLRRKCKEVAAKNNINLAEGVYLMVLGPNFETAAEVKAFAQWGADAVGMSTVPEVIAAAHCGMDVLGVSVITNYAAGLISNTPSHRETLAEADKSAAKMTRLISEFIKEME